MCLFSPVVLFSATVKRYVFFSSANSILYCVVKPYIIKVRSIQRTNEKSSPVKNAVVCLRARSFSLPRKKTHQCSFVQSLLPVRALYITKPPRLCNNLRGMVYGDIALLK